MPIQLFRAGMFIIGTDVSGDLHKVLQIIFTQSGAIWVSCPYFNESTGVAAVMTFPAGFETRDSLSYVDEGKITSFLVKYHHPLDGNAHFSQDTKVVNAVRNEATPLDGSPGHLFTCDVVGFGDYKPASPTADDKPPRRRLLALPCEGRSAVGIRLTAHWYRISDFPASSAGVIGPWMTVSTPLGGTRPAVLIAPSEGRLGADHVMILSWQPVPWADSDDRQSTFIFTGGFPPTEIAHDISRDMRFLALVYPATDPEMLKKRIGTIDYQAGV